MADDRLERLEDCGLLDQYHSGELKQLKVCQYQVATHDSHISGTVCSYSINSEEKIAIYAKTPGWMNFINDNKINIQKCLQKGERSFSTREYCKEKELYDVLFLRDGEKLNMQYSISKEWSFKTPKTKNASLKCKSL